MESPVLLKSSSGLPSSKMLSTIGRMIKGTSVRKNPRYLLVE